MKIALEMMGELVDGRSPDQGAATESAPESLSKQVPIRGNKLRQVNNISIKLRIAKSMRI